MNKIVNFDQLSNLVKQLQPDRIVLVGGYFDILHLGHVRFLKSAKKYGQLIVALESDENLRRYKGVSRPIHQQSERAEVLAELAVVDYIILLPPFHSDQDYYRLTQDVSPDVIAVTEGDPQLPNKTKQAKTVGAKIITIPKIRTPSTTQLAKLLGLENS